MGGALVGGWLLFSALRFGGLWWLGALLVWLVWLIVVLGDLVIWWFGDSCWFGG